MSEPKSPLQRIKDERQRGWLSINGRCLPLKREGQRCVWGFLRSRGRKRCNGPAIAIYGRLMLPLCETHAPPEGSKHDVEHMDLKEVKA